MGWSIVYAPLEQIGFEAASGYDVSWSGNLQHDTEITITGVGFGTKDPAPAWIVDIGTGAWVGGVWTPYPPLNDGELLPSTVWTKRTQAGVGRACSWWTSRPRRHTRIQASYGTVADSPTDQNHKCVVGYPRWPTGWPTPRLNQELYVSWYQKVKIPYNVSASPVVGKAGTSEDKIFRLSDADGDGEGSNCFAFGRQAATVGDSLSTSRYTTNFPGNTNWNKFESWSSIPAQTWDEYYNGRHAPGTSSYKWEFRPNGTYLTTIETPVTDMRWRPDRYSYTDCSPNMIGYDDAGVTNNSDGQEIDICEIYVDISPKRVELVDGDYTITAAQVREPCRIETWSDTEIKCHVNLGGFSTAIGKKLYVVLGPNQERVLIGQFTEQPTLQFNPAPGYHVSSPGGPFEHGAQLTITKAAGGLGTGPTEVHFAGGASGLIEAGTIGVDYGNFAAWPDWRNETDQGNKVWCDQDSERGKFAVCGPRNGVDTSGLQDGGIVAIFGPSGVPANSKLYFSQWFRRSAVFHLTGTSDRSSAQHKTVRPYWESRVGTTEDGQIQGCYLWFRQDNPDWAGSGISTQALAVRTIDDGEEIPYYSPGNGSALRGRETNWVRIEGELSIGPYATSHAQGVSSFLFRIRAKDLPPASDNVGSNPFSCYIGVSQWYRYCCFQNYLGNGYDGGKSTIRYDDCYVQFGSSFARLELTNSATWGQETRAEIQKPLTWTDTEITMELNQGGAASFVGMYLWRVLPDSTAELIGQFVEQ